MSTGSRKSWLMAYDIREHRRLCRVHRFLRKQGLAAQYSAFIVEADDAGILGVLSSIKRLLDPRVDDVRAYHIPVRCTVWCMGRQSWPEGVQLTSTLAASLLGAPLVTLVPGGTADFEEMHE
jgi:CRISPR-associated protein Cas2